MKDTPLTNAAMQRIGASGVDWHHSATLMTEHAYGLEREINRLKAGRFTEKEMEILSRAFAEETSAKKLPQLWKEIEHLKTEIEHLLAGNFTCQEFLHENEVKEQREEAERVRREVKVAQDYLAILRPSPGTNTDMALRRLEKALDITGEYQRENSSRQKQAIASDSKSP